MNQADTNQAEEQEKYRKNAIWSGIVILIAGALMVAMQAYSIVRGDNSADGAIVLTSLATLTGLLTVILSLRGQVVLGMRLLILAATVMLVGVNLFVQDLGLLTAVVLIVTISGLTHLTLPPKWMSYAIRFSVALGIVAVLLDLFGSPARRGATNVLFVNIVAGVLILIYGVAQLSQFPRFRLRTKLIMTITGISVVAVTAVIITVTFSTERALTETAGATAYSLANSEALGIGEQLSRQINSLEALALNKTLQDSVLARTSIYNRQEASEIASRIAEIDTEWHDASPDDELVTRIINSTAATELHRFRETFPNHVEMVLIDQYGAQVATTHYLPHYDLSDESWWRDTYAGGFGSAYVGEPYYSEQWGGLLIDVAVPMRIPNEVGGGSLVGAVLKSSFRVDPFIALLEQNVFGETGVVRLHVQDNTEIMRDETNRLILHPLEETEVTVLQAMIDSEQVYTTAVFHELPSLVSFSQVRTLAQEPRVNLLEWYVVVYQDQEEALAPVAVQQRNNIVLGMVVLVVAVLAAGVVGDLLARPITNLTETAVAVSQGDLTARASVTRMSAYDEIGLLANSFNQMTASLNESIGGLEARVQERTQALETSTEVGRQLSALLSEDELIEAVVTQVRDAFDYYHVHIYLLDKRTNMLKMAGGTGAAGAQMLARQHQIALGQGLVGRAAVQNRPVLVADVSQAPDWLPNPLLPDTKSEAAVPIALGNEVLGVLDVQQNITNGLHEADVDLLLSITNQAASALRNARLYAEIQQQAQQQATINAINQQIQSAADVQTALQIAIREVGRAVGAKQTVVRLVSESPSAGNGHHSPPEIERDGTE